MGFFYSVVMSETETRREIPRTRSLQMANEDFEVFFNAVSVSVIVVWRPFQVLPSAARYLSASSAAMQPVPALVQAWR